MTALSIGRRPAPPEGPTSQPCLYWDEVSITGTLRNPFPSAQLFPSSWLQNTMGYQSPPTTPCSVSPQAKLLDSQARVTDWFNSSVASLVETTTDGSPFSLTVRQDLVNGIVTALVPKEELVILLRYVVSPTVGGEGDSPPCHLPTESNLRRELPVMIVSALIDVQC